MADERLGASFSIDTTALKAGLAQANRLIRESESEFKAAAAGMDDWRKSEEGLEAKIKSLNSIQEIQAKKVEALKKQYEEAGYSSDDLSAAAVKLRTDINKEQEALAKTEKELRNQNKALDDIRSSAKTASESMKDVGDAAKEAGDGFTVAKGAAAEFIGNGLSSIVSSCSAAISSFAGLADETEEYSEAMNRMETAFEANGQTAEAAQQTYKDFYAVLGDEGRAVDAVTLLAKLTDNEKDLQSWTDIATGVWASYGEAIPIEGLTEAANETAKTGALTGVLTDAINWATTDMSTWNSALGEGSAAQQAFAAAIESGASNEDAYSAALATCSTEQERQQLITQTLNGLYGEAAEKYRENNEEIMRAREAQAEYNAAMAELGDAMRPITTTVKEGITELVKKFVELTEGVDFSGLQKSISDAFSNFTENIVPKILDFLGWIKDNGTLITDIITALVSGFLAFKVVTGIIEAVAAAQAIWNAVMMASPITWIVVGIAALIAAIVLLIKHWDDIKEAASSAWEAIKSAFSAAGEWFKTNIVDPIVEFFTGLWSAIKEGAAEAWEAIKTIFMVVATWYYETVIKPVIDFFVTLWDGLKTGASAAWEGIKAVFLVVSGWFNTTVVEPVVKFFSDLWNGLKTGAENAWTNIKNAFSAVASFFGGIWDTIKEKFVGLGEKIASAMSSAFKTAMNTIISLIEGRINSAIGLINSAITLINKLPKVNVGYVNEISLPRLARGGIVTGATNAIIGEDGTEAVLPLEKNTGWMRELAEEIAAKSKNVVVHQTNNYSQAHSRLEIYKSRKATANAVRLALGR